MEAFDVGLIATFLVAYGLISGMVVMITDEHILVQGKVVADMGEVTAQSGVVIGGLEQALRLQTEKRLRKDENASVEDREVTIMGDRELPYNLLKKVMASCTAADYGRISLAVTQAAPGATTEELIASAR